jgi:hypothetical protein
MTRKADNTGSGSTTGQTAHPGGDVDSSTGNSTGSGNPTNQTALLHGKTITSLSNDSTN